MLGDFPLFGLDPILNSLRVILYKIDLVLKLLNIVLIFKILFKNGQTLQVVDLLHFLCLNYSIVVAVLLPKLLLEILDFSSDNFLIIFNKMINFSL